jgi:hypothetical protein
MARYIRWIEDLRLPDVPVAGVIAKHRPADETRAHAFTARAKKKA